MAQMTWRTSEGLLERVRRQAAEQGVSLNEWVTTVLTAVADPEHEGSDVERVRARLRRAGLLEEVGSGPVPSTPLDEARLAAARVAAGRGTELSELVARGRR
jgi:hypothetical protein